MFGWIKSFFKEKSILLCVHGKHPFKRNLLAAKLFTEHLEDTKEGTIVCGAGSIVSVLESLGINCPDGMKFWTSRKKLDKANQLLNEQMPNVYFFIKPCGVTDLTWFVDEYGVNDTPTRITIYSGDRKQDPFFRHERVTYCADSGTNWKTPANQYCSSWNK